MTSISETNNTPFRQFVENALEKGGSRVAIVIEKLFPRNATKYECTSKGVFTLDYPSKQTVKLGPASCDFNSQMKGKFTKEGIEFEQGSARCHYKVFSGSITKVERSGDENLAISARVGAGIFKTEKTVVKSIEEVVVKIAEWKSQTEKETRKNKEEEKSESP